MSTCSHKRYYLMCEKCCVTIVTGAGKIISVLHFSRKRKK